LSILVNDCIAKGKDYNDGGPRYNTTYIMGVAPGSSTDILSALKYHVFEQKNVKMGELLDALANNFEGNEKLRLLLWNKTPKYGNDDDYADEILKTVFDAFFDEINGRKNTKGGTYRVNYLSTTCHVYFGSVTGATPDGRKAWEPLSDGISPMQGADRKGPTGVIKSAGHRQSGASGADLFQTRRPPYSVQRGDGGDFEEGAEGAGEVPRPDRAGGGLQRLLLRFDAGAAERDHRENRADGFLVLKAGGRPG
jgi:pyruvate-formate lyase